MRQPATWTSNTARTQPPFLILNKGRLRCTWSLTTTVKRTKDAGGTVLVCKTMDNMHASPPTRQFWHLNMSISNPTHTTRRFCQFWLFFLNFHVSYMHGGAWCFGHPYINTGSITRWLLACRGYIVVSIGYRFAPRQPWPAQLRCLVQALRWVRRSYGRHPALPTGQKVSAAGTTGTDGVPTAPMFLVGASAGAHVSVTFSLIQALIRSGAAADHVHPDLQQPVRDALKDDVTPVVRSSFVGFGYTTCLFQSKNLCVHRRHVGQTERASERASQRPLHSLRACVRACSRASVFAIGSALATHYHIVCARSDLT